MRAVHVDTIRSRLRQRSGLFIAALAGLSLSSVGFFIIGAIQSGSLRDWYLLWNLFLAWIPLALSYYLVRVVATRPWSSWPAIGLSLAWLVFLPNSFYIVSDLIHLHDTPRSFLLFDSLMFTLFIITGLLLGCTSLYLVQYQLRRRLTRLQTAGLINTVILLCSFAIYLGRDLRWNSWDVLVNPAGILFDISERILDPLGHPLAFSVTAMFFFFLSSIYWTAWLVMRATIRTGSAKL